MLKAFPRKALKLTFSSQNNIYLHKWLKQNQEIIDFTEQYSRQKNYYLPRPNIEPRKRADHINGVVRQQL